LNEKTDKVIWLNWMELRVHNDVDAINTQLGNIPRYEDLKRFFKEVQGIKERIMRSNLQLEYQSFFQKMKG